MSSNFSQFLTQFLLSSLFGGSGNGAPTPNRPIVNGTLVNGAPPPYINGSVIPEPPYANGAPPPFINGYPEPPCYPQPPFINGSIIPYPPIPNGVLINGYPNPCPPMPNGYEIGPPYGLPVDHSDDKYYNPEGYYVGPPIMNGVAIRPPIMNGYAIQPPMPSGVMINGSQPIYRPSVSGVSISNLPAQRVEVEPISQAVWNRADLPPAFPA